MIKNIILKHFKWKIINLKLTYYSFNIFLSLSLSRYNLSWVISSLQQLLPAGMNIFFMCNKKNYAISHGVFRLDLQSKPVPSSSMCILSLIQ